MHQLDFRGQQLVDPIANNGMRLPASDFHQYPGAGDGAVNLVYQMEDKFRITIFSQEFHLLPG
jgi:hypothetical protein